MSDSGKQEVVVQTRERRGGKLRRCIRRFWWLCLGALIAIILIVVLIIIYVAIPKMAQDDVNESTIEIKSLTVMNPTANSVQMIQDAVSSSNASFHPWLDPFNVSIALQGAAPYAMMELPGTNSGTAVPVHINQTVEITNLEAFKEYNAALMKSEKITQSINGSTWLHEGSLPADYVSYDKTVDLVGFNSLKGFNLTSFKVLLTPQPDGTNALGTVLIPNPTVLTIYMGNVTFDQYVPKDPTDPTGPMTLIGNATLRDFVFKPGNNTYDMNSIVDQTTVLGLISGDTYKDGVLPITVVGKSSIYNGVHLTYYEAALAASNQSISLNATAAISAAAGGNLPL